MSYKTASVRLRALAETISNFKPAGSAVIRGNVTNTGGVNVYGGNTGAIFSGGEVHISGSGNVFGGQNVNVGGDADTFIEEADDTLRSVLAAAGAKGLDTTTLERLITSSELASNNNGLYAYRLLLAIEEIEKL